MTKEEIIKKYDQKRMGGAQNSASSKSALSKEEIIKKYDERQAAKTRERQMIEIASRTPEEVMKSTYQSYIPEEYKGTFENVDLRDSEKIEILKNTMGADVFNYNDIAEHMTEDELKLLKKIYEENGLDILSGDSKHNAYIKGLREEIDRRRIETAAYNARKNDDFLGKVGTSVKSVGNNLMSVATMEGVGNAINGLLGYEIDETPYFQTLTEVQRQAVSEDMSGFGKFLYNTGMAEVDSKIMTAIGALIGGGTGVAAAKVAEAVTMIGMGSQAMSSTIADAKRRGKDDINAVLQGVLAGIAEAYFEKRGLGALFDSETFKKSIGKYLLANVFQNAVEEAETEAANIIADSFIEFDKSNFNKAMQEYKSQGMSDAGAAGRALLSSLGDVALSAASGALMGLGSGGAGVVGHTIKTNAADVRRGRQITELAHANTDLYGAAKLAEDAEINKILDAIYKAQEGSRAKYRLTGKLARKTETASKEYFTDEEAERFGESYEPTPFEREYGVYSEKVGTAAAVDLNEEAKALAAKDAGEDYGEKYEGETRDAYYKGLANYKNKEKAYQYPLWFEIARKMGQDSNGRSVDEMIKTLPFSDRRGVLSLDTDTIKAEFNDGKRIADAIAEEQRAADERRKRGEERIAERKKAVEAEKGKESTEGEKTASETTENTSNVTISDDVEHSDLSPMQKKAIAKIKQVMKYIPGYEVTVQKGHEYDGKLNDENGYFDPVKRMIYLNIDAGKITGKIKIRGQDVAVELYDVALESALTHEIGHAIRMDSPKLYAELRDFIRTRLYREGGFQNLVKQRQRQYADVLGREISYEYAEEEVICNSLGDILTSERVMDELAGTHRNLFARIWRLVKDFFKKIFQRMRSMDGDFAYKTTEQRVVEKALLVERRRLEDLFVKALRDASATSKATLALGKSEAQKNVQKSTENSAKSSENAENTQKTATQPQKNSGSDNGIDASKTEKTEGKWSLKDKRYLDAVSRGDMETAQAMVDETAKKAGYTDTLYHGTKQFGFTVFDPSYSDDKISIFVAGNPDIAQTYSGRSGVKRITAIESVEKMNDEEVVHRLNEEVKNSYNGEELKIEYEIMHLSDVNALIGEVNEGVEKLRTVVDRKIKELANKMAEDFDDKDADAHQRLISLKAILDTYQYDKMSTPIYMLLHYTTVFENGAEIADLEYKIRLMNKLTRVDNTNGIVVKKDLDGYGINLLAFNEARAELKDRLTEGNYALYGNPKNQLVIDCKGRNWNDIKNWIGAMYYKVDGTTVERRGEYFRLYNNKTGDEIFHGRIAVNENNEKLPIDQLHTIMVQKANNNLAIRSEYMKTTRDIARFAKENGYDSVKFENLVDNGGMGESVGAGDVYVYFDPTSLKSSDPVTYDDNGNVIPLSKRFNAENKDIRWQLNDFLLDRGSLGWYNEIKLTSIERERIQSEALTWDAKNRNVVKTRTLSNEISYRYFIDDDGIIHVIGKKLSINIHEWRNKYGDRNTEQPDRFVEELGYRQRNNSSNSSTLRNGREQRADDQRDNRDVLREGNGNGAGNPNDRTGSNRRYQARVQSGTTSPYLPVVKTFIDIAGKRQNVLKVNSEYMIEGDTHSKYRPSIEAAIEAHNDRLLKKYAKKYDTTVGATKARLAENPNFLKDKFSLRDTLAREQLSAMFYEMAATPVEREIVEKYKAEIVNIDAKIDERREILERLSEIEGKSGFGGERERLEGRLKGVNAYITGRDRRLFELESAKPFKEMVERYDAELAKKRESAPKALSNSRYTYVNRGKYNELIAKERGGKVYTLKDAQKIEGTIPGFDKLSRRKKNIIVDELWQGMNAAQTEKEREGVIRSVGDMIFEELSQSVKLENPEYAEIEQTLLYLSGYVQRLSFTDEMKGEIRHRLDESGAKSFMGRWQNKKSDGKAVPAETFVTDFAREVDGYAYLEDMNAADALFEIDELYGRLKNVDETVDAFYDASSAELQSIRDSIDESLREAFAEGGKTSESEAKQKVNEVMSYHKATLAADREARSIRDLKRGTFDNATEIKGDRVMELLRELSKFEYRGTFSVNNFREKVRGLNEWYHSDNAENQLNKTKTEDGEYSAFIANTLQQISSGKGRVTADELWAFSKVLAHFRRIAEGYNKVWRAGKWEDALPIAQRYVGTLKLSRDLKGANTFFQKVYRMYFNEFADPLSVVRRYDGYIEDGYFTDMFLMFRDAAVELETTHSDVMKDYHTFLDKKENKHYLRDLQERYVEVYGERIPMEQALSLYMMLRQDHALMGFVDGGVQYKGFDGDMHMARSLASKANIELKIQLMAKEVAKDYGISMKEAEAKARETVTSDTFKTEDMTIDELRAAVKPTMDAIKEKMTDADRELLSIIEKSMNGTLRELKRATDLERLGFSNVMEGFYFPIKRAGTAEKVETLAYNDELQSVSNISANKSREKGARQPLRIDSIIKTYERHAKAIVTYATMQQAVDFYDRIYNVSVTGNPNDAEKVATAANEVWGPRKAETRGNHAFFKELITDIQGLKTGKESIFNDMVGLLRGGMATAGIGLNGKVLLSQWSSYAAALPEMSFGSLMKAAAKRFGVGAKGIFSKEGREALIEYGKIVDEYCPLARVRHEENYAYLAQGVIEKDDGTVKVKGKVTEGLNEFREATMKPIGWMDRAVVCTLFEACKYETATADAPLDSEENLKAAGKKLEEVILNTQQNAIATEKSRAMRSDQELMKGLVMFSSDAMRSLSRFLDYAGELHSINRQLKTFQMSDAAKETLQSRKKEVGRKLRNSIIAISANAIWMAALTLFFRFMRGKKIEREDILEDLALDIFTGYFGGMPLLRDLVDQVTKGYGVTDSALDSIGDFVGAFTSVFTTISKVIQGEREWGALVGQLRKFAFAIAQVTGIPVRNVWNCIYGWINIFSKDTADAIEGFLAG